MAALQYLADLGAQVSAPWEAHGNVGLPRDRYVVTTDSKLQLQLLGGLAVYRDGERLRLPQSKKTRALLSYLVLTGRPQRRARLCSLLWDVADDPRAALRWSLSKVRPFVNDADNTRIVSEGDMVSFDATNAAIDIVDARAALGADLASVGTDKLIAVAETFRGELLEGLEMSDFDEFQAWCLAQREDARRLRSRLLGELVSRLRSEPARALPFARALVDIEPVDEQVRAQLVELLIGCNRMSEARSQCELGQRHLRELGVEPSGVLAAALNSEAPPTKPSPVRQSAPPALVDESVLVGRRPECALLERVLKDVAEGSTERVALISGEPGVGKTRLLVALLEKARERGAVVLDGRAFEAERGRPFGPWIDALRRAPALESGESANAHLAPLLLDDGRKAAERTQAQMFQAVSELVAAHARANSLAVLAIDDVQWIDEASAELLHYVVRNNRDLPVLIALTARAGEVFDNESLQRVLRSWRRERVMSELAVGPLSESDTEALVAAISPDANSRWVFERCAGNPLFALELARSGVRDDADLAPTLADVVRNRMDRLSVEAADVLRWLSIFGPSARVGQLEKVIALPLEKLMLALEMVERHALVSARGDTYAFSHDLVRHVVYGELSEPRRRLMHLQVAQRLLADSSDENAAEIAHHANLAGDAAMAAHACVRAGQRSLRLFAARDALALAKRGARHAGELSEPERTTIAIDLWDVRLAAQTPEDAEVVAAELEALSERATDAGCLTHARLGFHLLSYLRWEGGRSKDAIRHMLHAEQLTRGADGPHRVEALAEAARCLVRLDLDLGHAQALALEASATESRLGVERPEVPAAVGMLRSREGALDEALASLRESQQRARRQQDRLNEFFALEWMAMLILREGRWQDAEEVCQRLVSLGDRLREGSEGPYARALAAVTALGAGVPDSWATLTRATDELRLVDAKHRLAYVLALGATIELDRGETDRARAAAEEALAAFRLVNHRSDAVWARALCAQAALACGDAAAHSAHIEALREISLDDLAVYARTAALDVLQID